MVAGTIQGLEPQDFARVQISAFHRGSKAWRHGVVDGEGRYRIQHLAPGDWSVTASLQGTRRSVNGRATLGPAGDVVKLDLEFGEASRITGRVLLDGRPLSAGFVQAICAGTASTVHEIGSGGRFEIAEVPHGDCTLQATGADRAFAGTLEVEVPAASDVLLELESGTLSGSVLSMDDRRPLSGARVVVIPERLTLRFYGSASSASETARTDAAGRFSFPAITPGSWMLQVEIDGHESHERKVEASGLADEVEILLRPTMPVVLVVRSADGSVPSQVWVVVPDERGGAASSKPYRPDGEGRVVLRRLPPDVRRLRVTGENGEAAEIDVGVRSEPVPVILSR
jgi:hypothetical protein